MSEHFLGSNKAFEILANLGLEPLIWGCVNTCFHMVIPVWTQWVTSYPSFSCAVSHHTEITCMYVGWQHCGYVRLLKRHQWYLKAGTIVWQARRQEKYQLLSKFLAAGWRAARLIELPKVLYPLHMGTPHMEMGSQKKHPILGTPCFHTVFVTIWGLTYTPSLAAMGKNRCSHEGCANQARKGGICVLHEAKRTCCSHVGCTNWAIKIKGARMESSRVEFVSHRAQSQKGQRFQPLMGVQIEPWREVFAMHGANLKCCGHKGCTNWATSFGVCVLHGADKSRCSHKGCKIRAFKGRVCVTHGALKKHCRHKECIKQVWKRGLCQKKHGAKSSTSLPGLLWYQFCNNNFS